MARFCWCPAAVLLLLTVCPVSVFAFNCSQPPVYVDIHKRQVHGSPVFQYGSFIGVGTAAQNQSLWPSLSQNHTTVADVQFCNSSSLPNCTDATRGNFDHGLSTSFVSLPSYTTLDTSPLPANAFNSSFFGSDTLHLYTHYFETDGAWQTNVDNSILEIATSAPSPDVVPGLVGMGSASTLLQALFDAGLVAARTFSLYIGSGMDRAGGLVNGSITMGGFDAGRFAGPLHTYPMDTTDANPMRVTVRDVLVSTPEQQQDAAQSKNTSLFDPAAFPALNGSRPSAFAARLSTDQYPLALPAALTKNFKTLLSAVPDNSWGDNSLRLAPQFNGTTLTVVLDDGFDITLPADVVFNASGISPVADAAPTPQDGFVLSTAFLAQVYLMADYEEGHFFLARAVPKNAPVMPRTFCPGSVPAPYVRPRQSAFERQGLVGAVVGAVIAAIGLAVVLTAVILAKRRKSRWIRDGEGEDWVFEDANEKTKAPGRRPTGLSLQAKRPQTLANELPSFPPPPKAAFSGFPWKR